MNKKASQQARATLRYFTRKGMQPDLIDALTVPWVKDSSARSMGVLQRAGILSIPAYLDFQQQQFNTAYLKGVGRKTLAFIQSRLPVAPLPLAPLP